MRIKEYCSLISIHLRSETMKISLIFKIVCTIMLMLSSFSLITSYLFPHILFSRGYPFWTLSVLCIMVGAVLIVFEIICLQLLVDFLREFNGKRENTSH
jgi:hypothetical protein